MAGRPPSDELMHFMQQHNLPMSHISPGGTYHPYPIPEDPAELARRAQTKAMLVAAGNRRPYVPQQPPVGPVSPYEQNPNLGALGAVLSLLK